MTNKDSINHHLRREHKLMLWWALGIPAALIALGFLLGPYLLNTFATPSNSPNAMTEQQFWTLIEQAKGAGGDEAHAQRLTQALSQRSPQEIIDFQVMFYELRDKADLGDVWAAGMLINQGHGTDSGFEYFRIWLIGQGQTVYTRALSDADSLADLAATVTATPSRAEWESFGAAPYDAYLTRTHKDLFDDLPRLAHKGFPEPPSWNWQDYSDAVLAQRLPRLWALFGKDKQASDQAAQEAIDTYQSPESMQVEGLGKVAVGDLLIHKTYGPARVKALFVDGGPYVKARMVFDDTERSMVLTTMAETGPLWTRPAP